MKTEKLIIFVVEDSPAALDTITRELQNKIHCNVKGFTSAEDCIHRLEDGLPDLIISDYYLDALYEKKMNGDQMLAHVKKNHPDIPIIMYSSKNTADVVVRLMKLGAVDFVPREKNFLENIGSTAYAQIKKLKYDYEMRSIARTLLFIIILFISLLLAVYIYTPVLLPYFFIGGLVILIVCAFLASGKQQQSSLRSEDSA